MRQKIALAVAGPCDELGYLITPVLETIGQEHFLQCIA